MIGPLSIFLLLVLALSVTFYLLGAFDGRMLGLFMLLASSFMAFVPMVAAIVLVYRQSGACGIATSVNHMFANNRSSHVWLYIAALLYVPSI